MKKILLFMCMILLAGGASAQQRNTTPSDAKIEFEKTEHNFGKVPEKGKKVSYCFKFTNTGTHPLLITRVSTTCKCVDYNFSKKPIPPGGIGEIMITYNPKKQQGVFYKVIQIYTNTVEQRHIINIRGEIIE